MADYDEKPIKDKKRDKDVDCALKVIANYSDQRQKDDQVIDTIQSLLNESFLIQSPNGTQRLSGQLLFQALWRTASRMKPLDFMAHCSGADEGRKKVVRDGISTVLDRGQFDSCMTGKNGAFFDLLLYGDAFLQVGANDEDDFPILFSNGTLKNIYVNTSATGVRVSQRGRSARKMVIVFSYTEDEFEELWPEFEDKVKCGPIERPKNSKDQQKDWTQETKEKDEEIEVAFSYDLDSKCYLEFAGPEHKVLKKKKGEAEYPFIKNKKPYIPILQFICIPSNEGFRNIGIGHLLYRLTIVTRQLMNMEVTHIINNTLPIELVSVAHGKGSAFFQGLKKAHQMQAQGKRGFVPMERSQNDPNASAVTAQTLLTQNLFNEWSAIYDRLIQEVRRLGINIDEIDPSGNKTATEVIALEENSNAFVKQIGEWNGPEYQFAYELSIDMVEEFVSIKDKTPLDLTTTIETANGEKTFDDMTLGMLAEEFKKNRWFVRVDLRSGNILSNTMKYTRYNALLPFIQGTPYQEQAVDGISKLFDINFKKPAQPPAQPAPPGPEESMPPQPTATDRLELNPNVAVRGAAL